MSVCTKVEKRQEILEIVAPDQMKSGNFLVKEKTALS